jgi:acetyl-CoA carboxylase biotin carboxyl carrier protein
LTARELNRGAKLEPSVDLKEIKAIIDLMKKNSLTEFELELNDFKIKLRRPLGSSSPNVGVTPIDDPELTAYVPLARAAHPAVSHSGGSNDSEIKSPMIGTFYRSPSPEAAPYVDIGSEVGPDTVVCIIEAMKVMNEVRAEVRGVITSIPAENAKPVEFGQPLFKIRPL